MAKILVSKCMSCGKLYEGEIKYGLYKGDEYFNVSKMDRKLDTKNNDGVCSLNCLDNEFCKWRDKQQEMDIQEAEAAKVKAAVAAGPVEQAENK